MIGSSGTGTKKYGMEKRDGIDFDPGSASLSESAPLRDAETRVGDLEQG